MTATNGRLTTDQLGQLVARASTLAERLGGDCLPAGPSDPDRVAARLAHRQQLVGPSDPAAFDRRLAWDGVNLAQVRRALGPVRLADDRPLPAWASLLDDIAGAALARATVVVQRARHTGRYSLLPGLSREVYSPGFFQGRAGIGYTLLRLARPDPLAAVLLWE